MSVFDSLLKNPKRKRIALASAAVAGVAAVAVTASLLASSVTGTTSIGTQAAGFVPAYNTLMDGPTINDYIAKICIPKKGQPNLPKDGISRSVKEDGESQIPYDMRENVDNLVFVFGATVPPSATYGTTPANNTDISNGTYQIIPNVIKINTTRRNAAAYDAWLAWDPETRTLYVVTGPNASSSPNVDESKLIFNPNSDSLFAGLRKLTSVKMYTGGSFGTGSAGVTYTPGTAVSPTGYDLISPYEFDRFNGTLNGIGPSLDSTATKASLPLTYNSSSASTTTGFPFPVDTVNNTVKDKPSGWEFTYGVTFWNLTYQVLPTMRDPPLQKGLTSVDNLIDASYFDLTNTIYLGSLFEQWESLRSLEIRNWKTLEEVGSKINTLAEGNLRLIEPVDYHSMFKGMRSLEVLILPEKFVDRNVARIDHLFTSDTMLSLVMGITPGSNYKANNTWKKATTYNTLILSGINYGDAEPIIPGWDQEPHTTWGFGGRWYLDWDTTGIVDASYLFENCWSLRKLDITAWELRPAYQFTAISITPSSGGTAAPAETINQTAGGNMTVPVNPLVNLGAKSVNVYAMFDGSGLELLTLPEYPSIGYTPVPPLTIPTKVSQLDQPVTMIPSGCEVYDFAGNRVEIL